MAMQPRPPKPPVGDGGTSSDKPADAVGYGRPPQRTRFQPGRSGNPKGRPRGQCNVRTALERELKRRLKIREGDRTRSVAKLDAAITAIANGALRGDAKSQTNLIALLRLTGLMVEPAGPTSAEPMTADDQDILADFLHRHVPGENATAPDNNGNENRRDDPPKQGQKP